MFRLPSAPLGGGAGPRSGKGAIGVGSVGAVGTGTDGNETGVTGNDRTPTVRLE